MSLIVETHSSQDSKPLSPCTVPILLVLSTLTPPLLFFYCVFWNFYHLPSLVLCGYPKGSGLGQSHF